MLGVFVQQLLVFHNVSQSFEESIVSVILPCYIESDTLKSASWIYTYLPVAAMPLMLDIYSTVQFNPAEGCISVAAGTGNPDSSHRGKYLLYLPEFTLLSKPPLQSLLVVA